jgi:hypothetical protein
MLRLSLGYTEQYLDFNILLQQYSKDGLTILAFPCNQFGLQEPAKNHEILEGTVNSRFSDTPRKSVTKSSLTVFIRLQSIPAWSCWRENSWEGSLNRMRWRDH